ncbi:MAG: FtsB family cell division protein, partial [Bacteroidota bacterium]
MAKKKDSTLMVFLRKMNNRYILVTLGFLVWMTFFDKNDFLTTYSYNKNLNQLREQKTFYKAEIAKNKESMDRLKNDTASLEKYAREKYLMKKDNEDIFI